jgi:hypothetical protein
MARIGDCQASYAALLRAGSTGGCRRGRRWPAAGRPVRTPSAAGAGPSRSRTRRENGRLLLGGGDGREEPAGGGEREPGARAASSTAAVQVGDRRAGCRIQQADAVHESARSDWCSNLTATFRPPGRRGTRRGRPAPSRLRPAARAAGKRQPAPDRRPEGHPPPDHPHRHHLT